MEELKVGTDTLFILLGAIMVLAMHSGFAFLELGTVRKKSQVNALVKILCDFAISTVAYFFIGYSVAYGVNPLDGRRRAAGRKKRLRAGKILFPADLCGGGAGDPVGRHRGTGKIQPATRWRRFCWWGSFTPFSRALPGTTGTACRHGWRPTPAPSSTISPVLSSCTPSVAGSA